MPAIDHLYRRQEQTAHDAGLIGKAAALSATAYANQRVVRAAAGISKPLAQPAAAAALYDAARPLDCGSGGLVKPAVLIRHPLRARACVRVLLSVFNPLWG
jgi:hypothetical protein